MNPKEFAWNEDQTVTVTNSTENLYKFKVHNKEYQLGAHKTAKMPGYIAWVYVYGMSTQLCQADGLFGSWNEEGFRQQYYDKVVKDVAAIMQEVEVEEEPDVNTFDEDDDANEEQQPLPAPAAPEEPAAPTPAPAPEPKPQPSTPAQPAVQPAAAASTVKPMTPKPKPAAAKVS